MVHHEFQSCEFQKWAMIEVKTRRKMKVADPAIGIGTIRFLIFQKRVWQRIYAKQRINGVNLFLIENTTSMNVSFRQVFLWYFWEHYLSLSRVLEELIRTFNYFIETKMGDFYSIRYYRILKLLKWYDLNSSCFNDSLNGWAKISDL